MFAFPLLFSLTRISLIGFSCPWQPQKLGFAVCTPWKSLLFWRFTKAIRMVLSDARGRNFKGAHTSKYWISKKLQIPSEFWYAVDVYLALTFVQCQSKMHDFVCVPIVIVTFLSIFQSRNWTLFCLFPATRYDTRSN